MTRTTELKPCPFCGEILFNIVWVGYGPPQTDKTRYRIACDTCMSYGPIGDTEEDARKLWNKRECPQ